MHHSLQSFFSSKIKLVLTNRNIVRGLHKSTDHVKKTITLIEVQTWGSEEGAEHKTVPTNTKFQEKTYDIADIKEIEFEAWHFQSQQSKKYNKQDFFDNLGSSCTDTNKKPRYREKASDNYGERRGNRQYRGQDRRQERRDRNYDRKDRQEREDRREQRDERDYR